MSNAISSLNLLKSRHIKPTEKDFRLSKDTALKEEIIEDPLELKGKQQSLSIDVLGHQKSDRHISILA
jgi:hypothetical protein